MPSLAAIWLKRVRRGPMDPVERAVLEAGVGLRGNADVGGRRQVTMIERGRWAEVCARLDADLDPSLRRANLMIDGLDLADGRDRVVAIGPARIRIVGETAPCRLMDEQHEGLQDALRPRWGGGAYGVVERGGSIAIGDPVAYVD